VVEVGDVKNQAEFPAPGGVLFGEGSQERDRVCTPGDCNGEAQAGPE
jgi:hypothetical protein